MEEEMNKWTHRWDSLNIKSAGLGSSLTLGIKDEFHWENCCTD